MAKIYEVEVPFSGYCRGYTIYAVEAGSPEEAVESVECGREVQEIVVRDDRDFDWEDAEVRY